MTDKQDVPFGLGISPKSPQANADAFLAQYKDALAEEQRASKKLSDVIEAALKAGIKLTQ